MKFLVCVKHVPTSAATPRIAPSKDRIEDQGLSFEVNEPDLYAVEEALHQRSAVQGSVCAVTVGPARAKEALHVAYAKGVDQAVHVIDEVHRGCSAEVGVAAVAAVANKQGFDMILTGIQAEDDLHGQFGVALAEKLGVPVITAVTEIALAPGARTARVVRELGEGWKQELEVDLPCVATIQFGIRQLRYTPLMAIVKARSRRIDAVALDALGLTEDELRAAARVRVAELRTPPASGRCEMIEGSPAEMAQRLVAKMAETGVI